MGVKLEYILIVVTAAVLYMAVTADLKSTSGAKKLQTIELEFTDTTTREVDSNRSLSVSYGAYGVRELGVLTVDDLRYHSPTVALLKAKRGIYKGDNVYLDGNVSIHKELGSDYYAQHAVYNSKTGILLVTSPFIAVMDGNVMKGNSLRLDTLNNTAFATQVDAMIFTSEK